MDQYTMQTIQQEPQPVLAIQFECELEELPQQMSLHLPAIYKFAKDNGAEIQGEPLVRHSTLNKSVRQFTIGVPVRQAIDGSAEIQSLTLPGGKIAMTTHVGPHTDLEVARRTLVTWVRDSDFALQGGPWEIYRTDPMLEPDMTKWKTDLYQAIGP